MNNINKILIFVFILMFASAYADSKQNCVNFFYGVLGRMESKMDSVVELSDQSEFKTGDQIRINLGHLSKSNFYLIHVSSTNEISTLYRYEKQNHSKQDTIYHTILKGWLTLMEPSGIETFYFINSVESLEELAKLINRYDRAPLKGRSRLANRILDKINSYDPNLKINLADIPSRLEKPMVGGVTFRGDDDELLKDMSLIHECSGCNGTAYKKIEIKHN